MISLPFKILLFVLVDGWYLVVKSLLFSFNTECLQGRSAIMSSDFIIGLAGQAVYTVLKASAPMLLIGLDRRIDRQHFSSDDANSGADAGIRSENRGRIAVHSYYLVHGF